MNLLMMVLHPKKSCFKTTVLIGATTAEQDPTLEPILILIHIYDTIQLAAQYWVKPAVLWAGIHLRHRMRRAPSAYATTLESTLPGSHKCVQTYPPGLDSSNARFRPRPEQTHLWPQ